MTGQVYSVATLAEHWGCGTDTVYNLIKAGELPAFKLGGRLLRIRGDEVERYECQNTASNDCEVNSPSSGGTRQDAIDIRLERLIDHRPRQPRGPSGNGAEREAG